MRPNKRLFEIFEVIAFIFLTVEKVVCSMN